MIAIFYWNNGENNNYSLPLKKIKSKCYAWYDKNEWWVFLYNFKIFTLGISCVVVVRVIQT